MKVVITEKIHDVGIAMLKEHMDVVFAYNQDQETFLRTCIEENPDAIVIRGIPYHITRELVDQTPKLKAIAANVIQTSNVDLAYCKEKNIPVFNVPGGSAIAVAELAFGLLLALARNICAADHNVRRCGIYNKHLHVGRMLENKTLGIVSLGKIGMRVAKYAKAFDMRIIAYDPFVSRDAADACGAELVALDELFSQADFISIHTPLTPETKNLIGAPLFNRMKPTAMLINTGRGGVVNEADMVEALQNKKLAGAAFDVFAVEPPSEHPLFALDNVICTPHIGGSAEEAQKFMAASCCGDLLRYLGYI